MARPIRARQLRERQLEDASRLGRRRRKEEEEDRDRKRQEVEEKFSSFLAKRTRVRILVGEADSEYVDEVSTPEMS